MIQIIGDRGTGKTRKLMEIAKQENAVFVCSNPYHMREKAYNYGITGLTFISYLDYFKCPVGNKYVIDELERLISYINPFGQCAGYSLSKE